MHEYKVEHYMNFIPEY